MWLTVTGMIPADADNAWMSGTLTIEPLSSKDNDWADGTRRAAWPILGVLNPAGTGFETLTMHPLTVPGSDIGESVYPPAVRLIAELRDLTGRVRRFVSEGRVAASAPGEWNVNAPLSGVAIKSQNSGPNSWLELTVAQLQERSDAAGALLPQMTAKIGEVDTAIATLPPALAAQQQQVNTAVAGMQATVAGLVADTEQSEAAAYAAAGATVWRGGDRTTLPTTPGDYLIRGNNADAGMLFQRPAGGGAAVPLDNRNQPVSIAYAQARANVTPYDAPGSLTIDDDRVQWAFDTAIADNRQVEIPPKVYGDKIWGLTRLMEFDGLLQTKSLWVYLRGQISSSYEPGLSGTQGTLRFKQFRHISVEDGFIQGTMPYPDGSQSRISGGVALFFYQNGQAKISNVTAQDFSKACFYFLENGYYEMQGCTAEHARDGGVLFGNNNGGLMAGNRLRRNGHVDDPTTGYGAALTSVVLFGTESRDNIWTDNIGEDNIRKAYDAHSLSNIIFTNNIARRNGLFHAFLASSNPGYQGRGILVDNFIGEDVGLIDPVTGYPIAYDPGRGGCGLWVGVPDGAVADYITLQNVFLRNSLREALHINTGGLKRLSYRNINIDGVHGDLQIGAFVSSDGSPDIDGDGLDVRNASGGISIPQGRKIKLRNTNIEMPKRSTAWTPSTSIGAAMYRHPTTHNGFVYLPAATGTTGVTEPSWPTARNATVQDGGVTWRNVGKVDLWRPGVAVDVGRVILPTTENGLMYRRVGKPGISSNAEPNWPIGKGMTRVSEVSGNAEWELVGRTNYAKTWAASTTYPEYDVVSGTTGTPAALLYRRTRLADGSPVGATSGTQPTWPTTIYPNTGDGGIDPRNYVTDGAGRWIVIAGVATTAAKWGNAATEIGLLDEEGTTIRGTWTTGRVETNIRQVLQKDNFRDEVNTHPPETLTFSASATLAAPASAGTPTEYVSPTLIKIAVGQQVHLDWANSTNLASNASGTRGMRLMLDGAQVGPDITQSGQYKLPVPGKSGTAGGLLTIKFFNTNTAGGSVDLSATIGIHIQAGQPRP